jgi:hypothetical protein
MDWELYQFLKKNKPSTWGEALGLIQEMQQADQHDRVLEIAGSAGLSVFMTDLLWHITMYGPNDSIQYG